MRKIFTHLTGAILLLMVMVSVAMAQNVTISGTVTDKSSKETLPGVSVTIKGKTAGASTNGAGKFTFSTDAKGPFTLVVSYLGYKTIETTVNGSEGALSFQLEAQSILGQEVVVAASRTPEKILESPVSIERVSAATIREGANNSFYDALANLKGVELSAQSLTFKSVSTRGFNSNGNVRFNQFIDGMDNQAPGLNFSVGNIIGISELDVESVELLPGASSALYGAGGINGTMLMTSKNPFTSQGLSLQLKSGINHVNDPNTSSKPYNDFTFRFAKAWNNKLAFKTTFSYLTAEDWQGSNFSNFDRATQTAKEGDRVSDTNYDGINVYGDEINTTFGVSGGYLNGQTISRTGYNEVDLVDYNTKSIKSSTALHYKLSDKVEAIVQANWGAGTSVYTGSDRYSLKDFTLGQYKLELKGVNFNLKAYTTQERSGDAYNATALASLLNEYSLQSVIKDGNGDIIGGWFPTYAFVYNQAKMSMAPDAVAHAAARAYADGSRLIPGTEDFEAAKKIITSNTIGPDGGAKFNDKTNLYHYEGTYNLTSALKNKVEFIVGASYRTYDLNSDGTIFDDADQDLSIGEYGFFAQMAKKLFNEKLKLTAAGRYDKNENFEGRFTPRFSGVYTVAPNNNIRVSYQTGFRNPTTQNQYIDLEIRANTKLIGGLPAILDKYDLRTNEAFTAASVAAFKASSDPNDLEKHAFTDFKPESVESFEIGYKGLLSNNLMVDVSYYSNSYKNFISTLNLVQTPNGSFMDFVNNEPYKVFSTVVNNPNTVKTEGWALGLDYVMGKYNLSGNVSQNSLKAYDAETFGNDFNTPKYRYNLTFGNKEIAKNVGFNISYRWQDKYQWNSSFAAGEVPSFTNVDAQVSYRLPKYKSTIKLGGSNIFNKYYYTSYGNPAMGAVYYVSFTFDQLMRK